MPANRKFRILLVDDDKIIRSMVANMLDALGYSVVSTRNGLEALYIFTNDNGFDLVLTDIEMPLMDGWQLSRRLKEIKPDIHIIAITGKNPGDIRTRLRKSPIRQALFKPFDMAVLSKAVETLSQN